MKDIVDACDISRGGLYLYFSSTREIFLEVLKMEQEEADDVFEKSIAKEQKRELVSKKPGLNKASYEFFMDEQNYGKDNFLKKQFDSAVVVIQKLIEAGVENGEFYCEDARRAASNIMYVLEGLKIASLTRGITEAAVDREIMYVMQGLVAEE